MNHAAISEQGNLFANALYNDILDNSYLRELYDKILRCYTLRLFQKI